MFNKGIIFALILAALLVGVRPQSASAVFPNQDYDPNLLFQQISPTMGAAHHNQPHPFNGHVILGGNAVHEVWDISDPFNPSHVVTFPSPYHDGEAESHTLAFAKYPDGTPYLVTISGFGIDLWDMSDIQNPSLKSAMILSGINYGDASNAVWGVYWQGNYIYVGGTDQGLFIVDASDPSQPTLVQRVPTTAFDSIKVGPVFPVGNLLVFGTPKDTTGMVTMDISDPANPVLLDSIKPTGKTYISWFYGRYAFEINPIRPFDVTTDPTNITALGTTATDPSEYIHFGDDHLFLGHLRPNSNNGISKYRINNEDPSDLTLLGKVHGRQDLGGLNDDQFSTPIGNLLVISDDQANFGSFIAVHDIKKDTKPPRVIYVNPPDGATNQALTTRVGLSLSDQLELNSVDASTVIVRPLGGSQLTGKWGLMHTVLNFWPDQPLEPNTTYEVILPAGGITDPVGNGIAAEFRSLFSTGPSIELMTCDIDPLTAEEVGQTVQFSATVGNNVDPSVTYKWDFGDGSTMDVVDDNAVSHIYSAPGRYGVFLRTESGSVFATDSKLQIIYQPPTAGKPTHSSTIIIDETRQRVWGVNSDSNTVSAVDMTTLTKDFEVPVGEEPRTLAQAPDGLIWVVNQESADISVLDPDDGHLLDTITLAYASAPYGIAFGPDGAAAYVTLQATGRVVKLDPAGRTVVDTVAIGPDVEGIVPPLRGIAVSYDSARILVTRFISPQDRGEVYELDAATFALVRTFNLADSPGPDDSFNSRGIPNYVSSIAISPDGLRTWVPSKKDNTDRGTGRDGQALTHDSTVRAIVSQIDLNANAEVLADRVDLDNRNMPFAAVFSPLGDLVFTTTMGNNKVEIVNAYTGENIGSCAAGLAPKGLALSADGKIFVNNFMSRSVSVCDVADVLTGTDSAGADLGEIPVVANELLTSNVLTGKQLFYNAALMQITPEGYISCAGCHLGGGQDGRVWDFTDRGEGFRNTISLRGRAGTAHGPVHWTANFDEIHDFENDIRGPFGGLGLMTNADFNAGTRSNPLGAPKAGLSADLDALAAYVATLDQVPPSPYRNPNGSLTADGQAGKDIYIMLDCSDCHAGRNFTDSPILLRHDVGTIKPTSGQRIGGPLDGLDTPTLKGIWKTAPYLHDGSANTLYDVINNPLHGGASTLSASDKDLLVAYLLQIDEHEYARPDADVNNDLVVNTIDFALMNEKWMTDDCLSADLCGQTDLNASGQVEAGDAVLLAVDWLLSGTILDHDPPLPNPATWQSPPQALGITEITMTVTIGQDPTDPLEYDFQGVTPGGHDSGWQSSPSFTDTGLQGGATYGYRVRLRDALGHVGQWSAVQSATTDPDPTPTVTEYQAEDYTALLDCTLATNHAGYTGAGFMDYGGSGAWIEWNNIDGGAGGTFDLIFRYGNGSAADRPCDLIVNGNTVTVVAFPVTGTWPDWSTTQATVTLGPGLNTVRVMANTSAGGPNLDRMDVSGP